MKVILLAAGQSNRIKPLQDKNFIKFCGKPLIEHQLEQLYQAGLRDFLIVGGKHNLIKLEETAKIWANKLVTENNTGFKLNFVEQINLNEGMAGAMKSAEPYLREEAILIVSSNDIVESAAYKSILEKSTEKGLAGLIIGRKVTEYFPGGYLTIDQNDSLLGIVEKPGAGNEPSDLINLVIHFHCQSQELLKYLHNTQSDQDDLYETALAKMIEAKLKFKVVAYEGFWQAIKYPWHVLNAARFLFEKEFALRTEKISPQANIAPNATLKGRIIVEEGVKVLENAVIQGPCYLGKNVIVANNALVRESFLEDDCVVGYITEIARSFLGENVWTHSNYIGDSVIGNNVSFGAGCVTGNLRLDEKTITFNVHGGGKTDTGKTKFGLVTGDNIRCGINVSFMPGIKVGNNCFIGAGTVIAQDIEDNKFVYGKMELTVKENTATLDQNTRNKMKEKLN